MELHTTVDIFEDIACGQRSGFLRKKLRRAADGLMRALLDGARAQEEAVAEATQVDAAALVSSLEQLIETTDALTKGHDAISQISSLERRTEQHVPAVSRALKLLKELSQVDFPDEMLSAEARQAFDALKAAEGNAEVVADSVLNLGTRGATDSDLEILRSLTFTRLWAIHSLALVKIANAEPDASASDPDQASALRGEFEGRVRALRDAAHAAAGRLSDLRADSAFAMTLWVTLFHLETWMLNEAIEAATTVSAAAAARIQDNHADAERMARDAALIYDAFRTALALDAGIRAVLRAYAMHDAKELTAFAATRHLALGSATLDLPRNSLAQAADAEQDAIVEIAGIVREADITVGGPAPRSVLLLGSPSGTQIRVLVPFTAVDSFGIAPDLWVQVRGAAHPEGKDDLVGPVVQVRRIKRAEAASSSFLDALIHAGRHEFELRPGGLDLIGGRLAGNTVTTNEIGLRR